MNPARFGSEERALLLLTLLLTALLVPRAAWAQACCSGAAASEFGIVGRDDRALVGARLRAEHLPWTAGEDGEVRALEGASVSDFVLDIGGGVRPLGPRLQLQALLPLRLQHRAFGELDEVGGGLGDASLFTRFVAVSDEKHPLALGGSWVPFVEPYVGVRFPTGRAPASAELSTLADVTGGGAYALLGGFRATRAITHDDTLLLGFGYGHSFPHDIDVGGTSHSAAPGDDWALVSAWFHAFGPEWLLGVSAGVRGAGDAHSDGANVEDSSRHRVALGADLSYLPEHSGLQLRVGSALDPPIDGFAKNEPFLGFALALSVEYHFAERARPKNVAGGELLRGSAVW